MPLSFPRGSPLGLGPLPFHFVPLPCSRFPASPSLFLSLLHMQSIYRLDTTYSSELPPLTPSSCGFFPRLLYIPPLVPPHSLPVLFSSCHPRYIYTNTLPTPFCPLGPVRLSAPPRPHMARAPRSRPSRPVPLRPGLRSPPCALPPLAGLYLGPSLLPPLPAPPFSSAPSWPAPPSFRIFPPFLPVFPPPPFALPSSLPSTPSINYTPTHPLALFSRL